MSILIVTGIEGARNCAAVVAEQIGVTVEVAEGRKTALAAMPSGIADKLRLVADLANSLRQQLNAPARAARQTSAPTL